MAWAGREPASTRTYKVLIVDDNPNLLLHHHRFTAGVRELPGRHRRRRGRGSAAFHAEHSDCMVIDVRCPAWAGPDWCGDRGDPETAGTPLIILTALAQEINRFTGMAAGVDCYLTKPVARAGHLDSTGHCSQRVGAAPAVRMLVEEPPPGRASRRRTCWSAVGADQRACHRPDLRSEASPGAGSCHRAGDRRVARFIHGGLRGLLVRVGIPSSRTGPRLSHRRRSRRLRHAFLARPCRRATR